MSTPSLVSGMLIRPSTRLSSCNNCCSLTELAVGFTEFGCCAIDAERAASNKRNASAAAALITFERNLVIGSVPPVFSFDRLNRDRLFIGSLPAPGAGAVTAFHHALLVDLRDDVAIASKQRFCRAHL